MFIKSANNSLVFVKSKDINIFPCSRRRSMLIDADNDNTTVSDRYYIPFDPEARLNTEANNRKHTGLNGFRKSYIIDFAGQDAYKAFNFVIEGYHISIKLDTNYATPNAFGIKLASELASETETTSEIFANITLREVPFFGGSSTVQKAYTEILRDQIANNEDNDPELCLDCLIANNYDKTKLESYYFSGLSFSSSAVDRVVQYTDNGNTILQRTVSLKILAKNTATGEWELYYPSMLPKIEHGETAASVHVPGDFSISGGMTIGNILEAKQIVQGDHKHPVVVLDIKPVVEHGKEVYQLQFNGAVVQPNIF